MTTRTADTSHFVSANLTSNKFKNRLVNVLPCKMVIIIIIIIRIIIFVTGTDKLQLQLQFT